MGNTVSIPTPGRVKRLKHPPARGSSRIALKARLLAEARLSAERQGRGA